MKIFALIGLCFLTSHSLVAQTISYNGLNFVPETTPSYVPANQAATARPGYSLLWSDEFEYTSTSQLNTNWDNLTGGTGGSTYFHTTSNTVSFVTNDQSTTSLRLTENHLSTPLFGYDYEGAQIMSKKHFVYGYYEARIKVNNGRGAWPAFWLYGNNGFNSGEGGSTYAGTYNEVDIMECGPDRSFSKYSLHNAYVWHYDQTGSRLSDSYIQTYSNPVYYAGDKDLSEEYHIYGVDISPTLISYFLDGVIVATVTDPVLIGKVKKQAMWVTLDMAVYSVRIDYTTPQSNYCDVDYVRVYKKNPSISVLSHTCSPGNYTTLSAANPDWYSTLPNGKTITFQWSVSGTGVTIVGVNNSYLVTFSNPNNALFTATCSTTITYPDWAVATATSTITQSETVTTTFQYPNNIFSNVFNIGTPQCSGGNISATVTGVTNPPGGLWQLWNTDASGNFTGNPLQGGYGNSYTFTNLQLGTTYAVTRGVWDACTPWSFVQKNFKTSLSDFTLSPVTCSGNGNKLQVTCTAANNISGATWQLYPCDQNGVVPPNSTPVNGTGVSYTYNNLNPDSYYKIIRSEQSACSGAGSNSSKVFYVPDLTLDPYFQTTVYPDVSSLNFTVVGNNAIASPNSWWGIYNSNSAGDPLSQYGNFQSGSSASFGPSNGYYLYDGTYYLLVHAAYGDCSLWNWQGYLVLNNTRHPGSIDTIREVSLDSEQIVHLQNQLFADSGNAHSGNFRCFPNPTTESVNLSLDPPNGAYKIELYNSLGELVVSDEFTDQFYSLCLSPFEAGVYFLKVYDEQHLYTETIIRN